MQTSSKRDQMLPWYIGLVVILAAVAYVAYQSYATDCQATGLAQVVALIVMPAVYLALMYLTLRSQP